MCDMPNLSVMKCSFSAYAISSIEDEKAAIVIAPPSPSILYHKYLTHTIYEAHGRLAFLHKLKGGCAPSLVCTLHDRAGRHLRRCRVHRLESSPAIVPVQR